jgi:hypothetical protein
VCGCVQRWIASNADSRRKILLLFTRCRRWLVCCTGTSGLDTASSALRVAACLAYGVGRPTDDACLLACSLAGSLAKLLRVCVCGPRRLPGMVEQRPAGTGCVWRDEGQRRKAETRRAECRVLTGRRWDLAGYAGLSPISRAGCGTVAWRGEGKRMEKRWERGQQKICLGPEKRLERMKRVERVRDLKMGKRVRPA